MTSENEKIFGCLGVIAYLAIYVVAAVSLNGWVLTKLWLWFAVPTFGLPVLALWQAIGISLIAHLVSPKPNTSSEQKEPIAALTRAFFAAVAGPLLSLAFGWVVISFVK